MARCKAPEILRNGVATNKEHSCHANELLSRPEAYFEVRRNDEIACLRVAASAEAGETKQMGVFQQPDN